MTYLDQNISIPLARRNATVTMDWFAHRNNPLSPPRPTGNVVTPLVCGEEAFAKVYECIENAQHTIDLISWGFDPSMYLKRGSGSSLPLGDLLKDKAAQGVEVRVLIWNNPLAQVAENSVIGEGLAGSGGTYLGSGLSEGQPVDSQNRESMRQQLLREQEEERQVQARLRPDEGLSRRASRDRLNKIQQKIDALENGYTKGFDSGGTAHDPAVQVYTRDWFRWVNSDRADNIEFRTRDFSMENALTYHDNTGLGIHRGRLNILKELISNETVDLTWMQVLALSLFPSHHQKTLVTDYLNPDKAEGFVMGHNMHRNYWDTTAHLYDDFAAKRDPGFGPWQDLSLHVKGPILFDLNHNFCNTWDGGTPLLKRLFHGSLISQRQTRPSDYMQTGGEPAQICRTQPEEGPETSILEIYEKALGNVHNYAYVENQYFRYKPLAELLKQTAAARKAAGAQNDLHLFVVTNNPESAHFSSSTYEMLDSLGQGELMPVAHHDRLYDQRQLVYRERELIAQPVSPRRNLDLFGVRELMKSLDINEERADELAALDPNAHYRKAAARELEPELLPLEGMKVIIATLVSCDNGNGNNPAKQQSVRLADRRITEALGPEISNAKYKPIYVHSKLLLVDDLFFTLGSANINARSLLTDSELNISMPSPKTTKLWRKRLWEMHANKAIGESKVTLNENIRDDYNRWDELITDNWARQKYQLPLSGNLVKFWDLVTPYATAAD
ncbi:MAG: phospholipase [Gammaproteobacteria bacterium HGW-Gammaproteobacteria-6]|nr:MAG: phospholipase [Gammaproteobacteria bacterium HGW-Gammaproteobacteria-6]